MSSPPGALATSPQALPAGFRPRRYVATNQKGGQGKSTTAVNLGAEFAHMGLQVRIWDCDPQLGSATFWLPPQWDGADRERFDLLHVLMGEVTPAAATWPTTVPGLSIVPSFKTLAQFEVLRPPGAELVLRQAIDRSVPHDVEIVDCAPNLGLLTVAGITAADEIIITCKPGGLDMAGVSDLNATLKLVRDRLNPALRVTAVVICDKLRSTLAGEVERQLQADYPDALHQSIRHTVRVGEAPFEHKPLREYAPRATATTDYRALAGRLAELP